MRNLWTFRSITTLFRSAGFLLGVIGNGLVVQDSYTLLFRLTPIFWAFSLLRKIFIQRVWVKRYQCVQNKHQNSKIKISDARNARFCFFLEKQINHRCGKTKHRFKWGSFWKKTLDFLFHNNKSVLKTCLLKNLKNLFTKK